MALTGLNLGFKVTSAFFTAPAVLHAVDKEDRKRMSRAGAFVRRAAQTSMRYTSERRRKGLIVQAQHSPAGKPPRAIRPHAFLRKFLYFAYDTQARSVVVGPIPIPRGTGAAETLEYGGRTIWHNPLWNPSRLGGFGPIAIAPEGGQGTVATSNLQGGTTPVRLAPLQTQAQVDRANEINAKIKGPAKKNITLAARPYMAPALASEAPKFANVWKDALQGGSR